MSGRADVAVAVRLAPAKINLTLAVVGRRPDGFHALHSVMAPLALADRLSLARAAGGRDTLHVAGLDAGPPADNLVLRAIAATRQAVGGGWVGAVGTWAPAPALGARLEKRIPVAAGLAGGSSDAAAAIRGSLDAWGAELAPEEQAALAASIGSDVPFFLAADQPSIALVEGRGERVSPLRGILAGSGGAVRGPGGAGGGPVGVLLVTPAVPVSTADVFAAYAAGIRPAGAAARVTSEHLAGELRAGLSPRALLERAAVLAAANDLLPATLALVPELGTFRRGLARVLGRPVAQSGSGPTCFVLYPSEADAQAAASAVTAATEDGRLVTVGSGAPAVLATTIVVTSQAQRPGG